MKNKILLTVTLALCSLCTLNAQIKKGAVLLGGNIDFSTQKTATENQPDTKQNGISISPSAGVAVKENLIVGVGLYYSHTKYNFNDNNRLDQKMDSYGINVFLRKYKYLGSNFYLFGQGTLGGTYNKQENTNTGGPVTTKNETKGYNINLGFYPGLSYAISNRLQLETGLNNLAYINYSHNKLTGDGYPSSTTNSFSIGSSLSSLSSFTLGLRFLINR